MATSEPADREFQSWYVRARHLRRDVVQAAVLHGLEAQGRFADRPFREVERYLRESWEGMGIGARWGEVRDLVRAAYEWERAAGVDRSIELGEDAARRFVRRTVGGSATGGVLGDSPPAGSREPAPGGELPGASGQG